MSVSSEISRLTSAKANIKTAIEGKGVTVPSSTTLDGYASLISSIPSGGLPAWLKDGDTHLWINIQYSDQKDQQLRLRMIGTIDWGDGNTESMSASSSSTTMSHTYASTGKYRIDLKPSSGTFTIGGASSTYSIMGTASGRRRQFSSLYQIEIGSKRIVTISGFALFSCMGLIRAYVPDEITTIGESAFRSCSALREIEFEDVSKVTSFSPSYTFYQCFVLMKSPQNITGTTFTQPYYNAQNVDEITIPSTVTTLGASALAYMYSVKTIHCKPATPPTVNNANTFTGLPSTCVIEVPNNSLSAYRSATNWSTYASQMVGV